jgi:hypothetical protein
MEGSYLWVFLTILIVILILGFIFVLFLIKNKKKRKIDYYNLFIIGIMWVPLGIALGIYVFSLVGIVFLIFGFANKDKWETNRRTFNNLDKSEKRVMIFSLIFLFVLLIGGIIAFLFLK